MIKKVYFLVLGLLLGVLFSCKTSQIQGEEAWKKFNKALEFTSSLQYYSINTSKSSNTYREEGKLIYTVDDQNRPIAYKLVNQEEAWWFEGITYYQLGTEKLKKASSILTFLEISEESLSFSYERVKDCVLKNNTITFLWEESYEITAKLGTVFLEEITVNVKNKEEVRFTSITYTYQNPGKKPQLSLPKDLEEYHYL